MEYSGPMMPEPFVARARQLVAKSPANLPSDRNSIPDAVRAKERSANKSVPCFIIPGRRAEDEPGVCDFPTLHVVNGDNLDPSHPVRQVWGDNFLVDDLVARHHTVNEMGAQVRLFEAGDMPFPDLRCAACKQERGVLEDFRIISPTCHERRKSRL
jgi:hypothetical protein